MSGWIQAAMQQNTNSAPMALGENFPKLILQASMPEKMIATSLCITWVMAKNFSSHRAIVICEMWQGEIFLFKRVL